MKKKMQLYLLLLVMHIGLIKADDNNALTIFINSMKLISLGVIGILGYAYCDQYYYDNIATTEEQLIRARYYGANPDTNFKEYYKKKILKLEEKLKHEQEEKRKKEESEREFYAETGELLQQKLHPNKIIVSEAQSFFFSKQDPDLSYKNRFFSKALIRYQNKIGVLLAAPKLRICEQSAVYNREQIRKFHIDYDPNIDSPFM